VILAFGIGAIFGSLGLYMQANERLGSRLHTRSARLAVGALPVICVFALVALMLVLNLGSFTGPLALVGALVVPLLGGVFPMLILASARRRGERVPGRPMRWLGSWFVVSAVIALYLGGVIVQAIFIWSDPLERIVAIATALAMAALIVVSVRRGSFISRTVAELRSDEAPGGGMTVAVVADGRGVSERRLADVTANAAVDVELPAQRPDEVDVWAHRPTRDGDSEPIQVDVEVPDATHLVARPVSRWLPTG
jgi:hypothetical protein